MVVQRTMQSARVALVDIVAVLIYVGSREGYSSSPNYSHFPVYDSH
jgi:hypothetical protein